MNLCQGNLNVSCTVDTDFVSQLDLNNSMLEEVKKIVENGFFLSQTELNVPISPKVELISNLRLIPQVNLTESKMEVSMESHVNESNKINFRETNIDPEKNSLYNDLRYELANKSVNFN